MTLKRLVQHSMCFAVALQGVVLAYPWEWAAQAGGTPGYYGNFGTSVKITPSGDVLFTGSLGREGAFGFDSVQEGTFHSVFGMYSSSGLVKWKKDNLVSQLKPIINVTETKVYYIPEPSNQIQKFSFSGDSIGIIDFSTIYVLGFDATGSEIVIGALERDTLNSSRTVSEIAKIDNSGKILWKKEIGLFPSLRIYSVSILENGRILGFGEWQTNGDGDSLEIFNQKILPKTDSANIVLCLDSNGTFLWQKVFESNRVDFFAAKSFGPTQFFITGSFRDGAVLDNQVLHAQGSTDILLASFNNNGTLIFVKTFGSPAYDDACNG